MGLVNRLLSIVNDAKEKVEDIRDKKIQEIEDAKVKEGWYVSRTDQFYYVRVIEVGNSSHWGSVYYRTIGHISAINNDNTRAQMPDQTFIDCTHYAHNAEHVTEKVFNERFVKFYVGDEMEKSLEARYQEAISGWKERLEIHKRAHGFTSNEADSQRRLNEFLHPTSGNENFPPAENAQEPDEEVENVDHNNYGQVFSGTIFTNRIPSARTLNPYGGTAEIPVSLLPDDMKKMATKQIEEPEEKVKEPQKRLESIE